jgi:hypothetical protein
VYMFTSSRLCYDDLLADVIISHCSLLEQHAEVKYLQ